MNILPLQVKNKVDLDDLHILRNGFKIGLVIGSENLPQHFLQDFPQHFLQYFPQYFPQDFLQNFTQDFLPNLPQNFLQDFP